MEIGGPKGQFINNSKDGPAASGPIEASDRNSLKPSGSEKLSFSDQVDLSKALDITASEKDLSSIASFLRSLFKKRKEEKRKTYTKEEKMMAGIFSAGSLLSDLEEKPPSDS